MVGGVDEPAAAPILGAMDPAGNLIERRSSRLSWASSVRGPEMLHDRADVGEHEQPLSAHGDGQKRRNIIFADHSFQAAAAAAVLGDRRAAASTITTVRAAIRCLIEFCSDDGLRLG